MQNRLMRSACLGGVRLGHFGMSPWGKRKAAPLRCAPDRVLLRVMLLVVPIDNNPNRRNKKWNANFAKGGHKTN